MTIWRAVVALMAMASILAEVIAGSASHAVHWWHTSPAFELLFGFLGCVLIVVASKALGAWWVQRPEDYWEDER